MALKVVRDRPSGGRRVRPGQSVPDFNGIIIPGVDDRIDPVFAQLEWIEPVF
jgi:hypothetical protein